MQKTPDNQSLADQILKFPCFADAKKMKKSADEILTVIHKAYEQENLSEEQDLAFEAVLYFNELVDQFDFRRALSVWRDQDFKVFETIIQSFRSRFNP